MNGTDLRLVEASRSVRSSLNHLVELMDKATQIAVAIQATQQASAAFETEAHSKIVAREAMQMASGAVERLKRELAKLVNDIDAIWSSIPERVDGFVSLIKDDNDVVS